MLGPVSPRFWSHHRSAKRLVDLEQCGPLDEEDRGRERASNGRGRDDLGRATGIRCLRLTDELGCRLGADCGRGWLAFMVPVVRRSVGRALAAERPLSVRELFVFDGPSWRDADHARSLDLGDDAHRLRRARTRRISKLQDFLSPDPNFIRGSLCNDHQSTAPKISLDLASAGADRKSPRERRRNSRCRGGIGK
jgi:hypothetical protein